MTCTQNKAITLIQEQIKSIFVLNQNINPVNVKLIQQLLIQDYCWLF